MNEQENMSKDSISKELKINRVLLIVLIAILVFFFASFGIICYKTFSYVQGLKPIAEELKEFDFDKLNDMAAELESLSKIDMDKITSALENLDLEAIQNMNLESLENIDFEELEKLISSVDVNELENAMQALKDAAETLENVAEKINPILNFFN